MTIAAQFDPTPTAAQIAEWLNILFSLFGDGYTTEPDTLRYAEMQSYAYLFAFVDNTLVQAGLEGYVQTALDTLDDHELSMRLPNDSGVTDVDRKARVLALRSMRGMNDASISRVLEALGSLGPGEYRGVTAAEMAPELGLEPFHALTSLLLVGPSDLAEPRVRQALALILDRGLDASRFGPNHAKGSRVLASALGAAWGTAAIALDGNPQVLGAVAIDRSSDATAETTPRWKNRLRSFGPLSVVHLDDMRRVARSLAFQPDNGPSASSTPSMTGDLKCLASVSVGAGTNVLIEDSGVWINRFLIYTGQVAATDVRPGGAAEDGDGNRITPGFLDTAAGGVGTVATLAAGVELYADPATGLRIRNTGGATTYVNIFAWAASPYTGGAVGRLDPFGLDADTVVGLDATVWNTFVACLGTRRGAAADAWGTGELRGLVHRTCMTPNIITPSTAGVVEYVIDSTIDWRDRFVVVSVGGFDISAGGVKYAGGWNQDTGAALDLNTPTNTYGQFAFGYTGLGHAAAQAAAGQWDIAASGIVAAHVYARSTTGELVFAVYYLAAPPTYQETFIVSVIGSFQLGVKVTPAAAAPAIPTAAAAAAMRPSHLNTPQDYAVQGYGQALEAATADLDSVPLGLDVRGVPPIARVQHTRRDRVTGYVQDAALRYHRRERTDGGATCWSTGVYLADTHYLLDSTQDWRDRWIYRIGNASIGTSNTRGWYSGPGMTAAEVAAVPASGYYAKISTSALYLYADSTTGDLYLFVGAVAATVRNMIVGSPHIGGRAVKVAGRRSQRVPLDIGNLYLWVTARRCTLAGSAVRAVPVTEARAGVVHTASAINGFQSGGSPAVGFLPPSSGTYPWVGSKRGGLPPALRVQSGDDAPWITSLSAGTWAFLAQGPMTLTFVFSMIDISTPFDPRDSVDGNGDPILAMMFDSVEPGTNNTAGVQIGLDMVRGTLVFKRLQNTAGVLISQALGSRTSVRDGLPHYLVVRQTASMLEYYLDGRLEQTLTPTVYTQPSTQQPRLSSTYFSTGQRNEQGLMSQAGFDLFEIVKNNAALSDAQLKQLHAYLKKTYRKNLP
jgi:hypothetical protein